jgi:hypothetical protein
LTGVARLTGEVGEVAAVCAAAGTAAGPNDARARAVTATSAASGRERNTVCISLSYDFVY